MSETATTDHGLAERLLNAADQYLNEMGGQTDEWYRTLCLAASALEQERRSAVKYRLERAEAVIEVARAALERIRSDSIGIEGAFAARCRHSTDAAITAIAEYQA